MLIGIWTLFTMVSDEPFGQPIAGAGSHDSRAASRRRFTNDYHGHFLEVSRRFFDALDILQQGMRSLERSFNTEEFPDRTHFNVQRHAGMAADSVLQYLNMLIDDIGCMIPFAVFEDPGRFSCYSTNHRNRCDSLYRARDLALNGCFGDAVREVFLKLDTSGSWWESGFKPGHGMRQRVTHYPDMIRFAGTSAGPGQRFHAIAKLHSNTASQERRVVDFVPELRAMLYSFCEWLDDLDEALFEALSSRAAALGHVLGREPPSHRIYLPVHMTGERREIPGEDFLYLPTCDSQNI
jgi:hypothetical protein